MSDAGSGNKRGPDAAAAPRAGSAFSAWRLVTWLILLFSAFGILLYARHAWPLIALVGRPAPAGGSHAAVVRALAWDTAYLLGAGLSLTAAAGTLLRRDGARRLLRVLAVLLALWALVTGVGMVLSWDDFLRRTHALAQLPALRQDGQALIARMRRTFVLGVAMKLVSAPLLTWLAWRLGLPAVRAQFRARR